MAIAAKISLDAAQIKMSERKEEKAKCASLPVLIKLPKQLSNGDFRHISGSPSFEDCQNQLSQNIHVLKIARAVSLFGVLPSVLFILALAAEDIDTVRCQIF